MDKWLLDWYRDPGLARGSARARMQLATKQRTAERGSNGVCARTCGKGVAQTPQTSAILQPPSLPHWRSALPFLHQPSAAGLTKIPHNEESLGGPLAWGP
jgi:hypothetical protein